MVGLDKFMRVWCSRAHRRTKGEVKRYHGNPDCPSLRSARKYRSRLGAMMAAGREPCDHPGCWPPPSIVGHVTIEVQGGGYP